MRSDTYLSTFWPILKIYQVFGAFPIKKSTDMPCGFAAIQTWTYLVLVLSLILIGNVGQILSCYYIMRQYDQNLWSIMNVLFDLTGKYFLRFGNVFFSFTFVLDLRFRHRGVITKYFRQDKPSNGLV